MRNVLSTVPRTLAHGENTINDHCEIANVFNNCFVAVGDTRNRTLNISIKTFLNNLKVNKMVPNVDSSKKGYF